MRSRPPKCRARPVVSPTGFPRKCSSRKARTEPCRPAVNRTGAPGFADGERHLRAQLQPGAEARHPWANGCARSSEGVPDRSSVDGQSAALSPRTAPSPGPTWPSGGDAQHAADSSPRASARPAPLRGLHWPEPPLSRQSTCTHSACKTAALRRSPGGDAQRERRAGPPRRVPRGGPRTHHSGPVPSAGNEGRAAGAGGARAETWGERGRARPGIYLCPGAFPGTPPPPRSRRRCSATFFLAAEESPTSEGLQTKRFWSLAEEKLAGFQCSWQTLGGLHFSICRREQRCVCLHRLMAPPPRRPPPARRHYGRRWALEGVREPARSERERYVTHYQM